MKHKDRLNFGSSNAGCIFNKTVKTLMFPPSCLYTKTKQHLYPTTWAPVAFLRVTTDQGQWKVSGTPPGTLLRHHKNLVESSKRHLADPSKWEVTKPRAPAVPKMSIINGPLPSGCAQAWPALKVPWKVGSSSTCCPKP